jgi:hypothetical protein
MDGPPAQSSDRIPTEDRNTSSKLELAEGPKRNITELPEEAKGKNFMNMVDASTDSRAEYLAEEATGSISKTLPDDSPDSQAELSHMMNTGWSSSLDFIPIDGKERNYTQELAEEAKGSMPRTLLGDSTHSEVGNPYLVKTGCSLDSLSYDTADEGGSRDFEEEKNYHITMIMKGGSSRSPVSKKNAIVSNNAQQH